MRGVRRRDGTLGPTSRGQTKRKKAEKMQAGSHEGQGGEKTVQNDDGL